MQQGGSTLPCPTAPPPSSQQAAKAHLHNGTALIRETCMTNPQLRQRLCSAHSATAGAGNMHSQQCVLLGY